MRDEWDKKVLNATEEVITPKKNKTTIKNLEALFHLTECNILSRRYVLCRNSVN